MAHPRTTQDPWRRPRRFGHRRFFSIAHTQNLETRRDDSERTRFTENRSSQHHRGGEGGTDSIFLRSLTHLPHSLFQLFYLIIIMSGVPPSKDDPSDHTSPPGRASASGRSNQNTPSSSARSEADQRSILRHILTRGGGALEEAARQPGMPDRSQFPSQEAWLRAILKASLRPSDEAQDVFGQEDDRPDEQQDPSDRDRRTG